MVTITGTERVLNQHAANRSRLRRFALGSFDQLGAVILGKRKASKQIGKGKRPKIRNGAQRSHLGAELWGARGGSHWPIRFASPKKSIQISSHPRPVLRLHSTSQSWGMQKQPDLVAGNVSIDGSGILKQAPKFRSFWGRPAKITRVSAKAGSVAKKKKNRGGLTQSGALGDQQPLTEDFQHLPAEQNQPITTDDRSTVSRPLATVTRSHMQATG
ncbi:hypothetical protein B0H67DRAFT_567440 [Lasiosphaeris hirsuta]|uniref:Uncharacterized protein n=1 Tax=Lasiosphaeris hirsuta TaxID=260670 RepID=A0AA40E6F9_9PEZI|nr:hypothetical protein B0H67DRAFT_567440 [Lasiosphaeris hirsuta]